ncbi:MAG TPA: GGDEF domain-containing phosphodiesterase, partial [Frankiaceae bacterium]|nr:GGDEF domain-containing phosphodiesterase [Frankiaceae bacterium]
QRPVRQPGQGVVQRGVLEARIDHAFVEPFPVRHGSLHITASVGLAFAGPGEDVSDQLVVNADIAMYQAKRRGGASHAIIDLREALLSSDRFHIAADLAAAFAGERLDVAYQPIVQTSDGLITGVEALLRWNDPLREPIRTTTMVEIAEQNGLIVQVGEWVLERSCRDRETWRRQHPESPLTLAVNVSPRQLLAPDFASTVDDVLERTGMDPAALTLEMTESIFIEDNDRTMSVLGALKKLGVRLALDDFGTGYSSLSYLEQFPVDIVKIDQGFIANILLKPGGSPMPAAITHLAHGLGLNVIAEGVETVAQRDEMVSIGCEMSQGYYYARPMPGAALADCLGASPGQGLRLPSLGTAHPRPSPSTQSAVANRRRRASRA